MGLRKLYLKWEGERGRVKGSFNYFANMVNLLCFLTKIMPHRACSKLLNLT